MKELHALSIAEQDALLLRIYIIAGHRAPTVIRSRFRDDIVADVMAECLVALRSGTFTANLAELDAFVTTALKQRATEIRREQKDELEGLRDYRREVIADLYAQNAKLARAMMRRKVILFRPEVRRRGKSVRPTGHQDCPTVGVIHRSYALGRRLAAKAKEQTKWRVRRRERRDRAPGRTEGTGGAVNGDAEPVDGSSDGVVRRPGPIDRSS